MTDREYDDFELRLEYRVSQRGNSGVLVRGVPADDPGHFGLEIQILDDDGHPSLPANNYTGAIYSLVPRSPPGRSKGGRVERHAHRGQGHPVTASSTMSSVVDADLDDYKDQLAQKSG